MKLIAEARGFEYFLGKDIAPYESLLPTKCECGMEAPPDAHHQLFYQHWWSNPLGKPEPGDVFFAEYYHHPDAKRALCRWDNCEDPRGHLKVILPNGHEWDVDGRASNCTKPDDRLHRCWVRHGDPLNPSTLHVDKAGNTCNAGAGSILSGDYHGFLHHGMLTG